MSFHITSLIAGLMALMMVPLSFQISLRRAKLKTTFGDAEDEMLRRRIRAHGNFVEYVPTALIVLGLIEWNSAPPIFVWSLGHAFLGTRILHAYGMLYASGHIFRAIAITVQHVAFLVAGAWLLFAFSP